MKLELLYFGRPADRLKTSRESIEVPDHLRTVGELLAWLRTRSTEWEDELAASTVRCALNQQFCALDAPIKAGDEIAIFSPISGG